MPQTSDEVTCPWNCSSHKPDVLCSYFLLYCFKEVDKNIFIGLLLIYLCNIYMHCIFWDKLRRVFLDTRTSKHVGGKTKVPDLTLYPDRMLTSFSTYVSEAGSIDQ